MKTFEEIKNEIVTKLEQSNFNDIEIELCDDTLRIVPCSYYDEITMDNLEYLLVHGSSVTYLSSDNIDMLCEKLSKYDILLDRLDNEKRELKAYFDEHINIDDCKQCDFDFYSDWHKDVYGYRPHAMVCGEYVNPHTHTLNYEGDD